jgi:hypothetical protein
MTDNNAPTDREWLGDYEDPQEDCPNCGGEGYVSMCFEEFACIDPDGGCEDCMTRCDWCNPRKPKHSPKISPDAAETA